MVLEKINYKYVSDATRCFILLFHCNFRNEMWHATTGMQRVNDSFTNDYMNSYIC